MTDKLPVDSDTVGLVRDMVDSYVLVDYPFETRFDHIDCGGDRYDAGAWARYAEMGWLGVAFGEEAGGFEADPAIVAAIMGGVGAGLLLEPIFASAILSGHLIRLLDPAGECLDVADIASGRAIVALAHIETTTGSPWDRRKAVIAKDALVARKIAVLHGDVATHFLVTAVHPTGEGAIALVRATAEGVRRESYALLDGRGAATVEIETHDFTLLGLGETAQAALDTVLDSGIIALCAEALGAIARLNKLTLSYLAEREQFGRAIGANQVLQHRMVESLIQQAEVAAVLTRAQQALYDSDIAVRGAAVSGAMAVTAAAARHIANDAVQMHGGIGMTHEHAVSHYYKRLRVIELLLGSRAQHLRRFVGLIG